jgi:hypothetical protein
MKQPISTMNRLTRAGLFTAATFTAATITLLGACGGGGGGATVPQDGTVGVIAGFGSVIVNGVRYDDSAATVKDDHGASLSSSRLGHDSAAKRQIE